MENTYGEWVDISIYAIDGKRVRLCFKYIKHRGYIYAPSMDSTARGPVYRHDRPPI